MKNINVFVESIGKSKHKATEVILTVVWESGAITKTVKINDDLLTKLLLKNSIDTRQLMIHKVFGQGAV